MAEIIRCEIDYDDSECPFKILDVNEELNRLFNLLGIERGHTVYQEWLYPHEMKKFIDCLELMDYDIQYYDYFSENKLAKKKVMNYLRKVLNEQASE